MSNHQVDVRNDAGSVRSSIHATHVLGGDHWIFLGDYAHDLVRTDAGWRIMRMTANLRAQLGNPDLPEAAAKRVARGDGRPATSAS